jgi:hypothetical protein
LRVYINTMNENYIIELAEYDENGIIIPPQYKRVPSILEYIVNHRQDILEKVAKERITSSTQRVATDNNSHVVITKNTYYHKLICWYLLFVTYGLLGGVFINVVSSMTLFNYDMWFNVIVSPIIYYHSPRNILLHITRIDFIRFYTIPFICGLFFRFLDRIPSVSQFIMDPSYIHSTVQITLLCITLLIIILLSIYYIYISANPLINIVLFISELLVICISGYLFIRSGGNIHVHHYFIGLSIMLFSRNYHSKIVIISHAISYAIYIEGISAHGIDKIYM